MTIELTQLGPKDVLKLKLDGRLKLVFDDSLARQYDYLSFRQGLRLQAE